jgi:hypothetical protein
MTSFEQPDAGLLVEHLLPSLLGASHSLSQEVLERNLFFGELGSALEALHDRITVISSPPRGVREDAQYPWLWRYVSHFTVGAQGRAVQHAKLWAFHWKVGDEEVLELYVSSTNLTAPAFKSQVQAGWRATLSLGGTATPSTRRTWGELIPFLDALGASAGAVAASRIQRLVTLLGRVACPSDVTFVASYPGRRGTARQLAAFEPSEIHVLTPTIGEWNAGTLAAWCADVGVPPKKVHLKWISEVHPWAATSGWRITRASCEQLEDSGVQLECVPVEARLAAMHRAADLRWSHAKLYLLRSRRKRLLLVTSANWSTSAWGAGRITPRNFELGVIFESKWTDLESFGEPFDPSEIVPFCVDDAEEEERVSALVWAEAIWDGEHIALRARSTDGVTPITVVVTFVGDTDASAMLVNGEVPLRWNDVMKTPLCARFTQGDALLEVDVVDVRPYADFTKTPLPEVDPAIEQALREAFLLQRYGGPAVDPESIPGLGGDRGLVGGSATVADYSVQAWIDAREAFRVVDRWHATLIEATQEGPRRDQVYLDGQELRTLFQRRQGPAAALVVEELGWRLEEEAR